MLKDRHLLADETHCERLNLRYLQMLSRVQSRDGILELFTFIPLSLAFLELVEAVL